MNELFFNVRLQKTNCNSGSTFGSPSLQPPFSSCVLHQHTNFKTLMSTSEANSSH